MTRVRWLGMPALMSLPEREAYTMEQRTDWDVDKLLDWRGIVWGSVPSGRHGAGRPAYYVDGLIYVSPSLADVWRLAKGGESAAFVPNWQRTRDSEHWLALRDGVLRGDYPASVLI